MSHPIRDAEAHVFRRLSGNDKGAQYIARLYPYSTYPVFFYGSTESEALANLEATRAEAIEKHEAAVIARQEAAARAKATRDAKKGAAK